MLLLPGELVVVSAGWWVRGPGRDLGAVKQQYCSATWALRHLLAAILRLMRAPVAFPAEHV